MWPVWCAFAARFLVLLVVVGSAASAGQLYRYRDAEGRWQFTDRPPRDAVAVEQLSVEAETIASQVRVAREDTKRYTRLRVINEFHCAVEVVLALEDGENLAPSVPLRHHFAIPAQGEHLIDVWPERAASPWDFRWRLAFVIGDPEARHDPEAAYRVPYAASQAFRVSQGFNGTATHQGPANAYAVDFAMPVGTGVFAARGGRVVQISYDYYAAGTDLERHGPRANVVRIVHDDGTLALYAHLDRATVRVRPGDTVHAGQYIADSGNTGFSTGPHLHFAVLINRGMELVSLPFSFKGMNGESVLPQQGQLLQAYP